MKSLILIAALVSSQAFACSPMLPAFAQITNVTRVLNSESFLKALTKLQVNDNQVQIKKIDPRTLQVQLSNGCVIESQLLWKPVNTQIPGMCPQFDKVKSKAKCM